MELKGGDEKTLILLASEASKTGAPDHVSLYWILSMEDGITDLWNRAWSMGGTLLTAMPKIFLAMFVFCLFFLAGTFISRLAIRITLGKRRHRNFAIVFGRMCRWSVVFLGFLISITMIFPSVKASSLIQLLGISSVAFGFAFRDILQNFLAGILLLLTEYFGKNDQIVVSGFEGTIEEVQTRATVIRTYDNRRVVIPNSVLFTQSVTVNTAFPTRRLQYDLGIGYGDDLETARRLILDALNDVEEVLADPSPAALVSEMGESAVNFRLLWWIRPPIRWEEMESRDRVLTAVKKKLIENGIDLPFPTRQILFHDQTEESDGDRSRQREGWPKGEGEPPGPGSLASVARELFRAWRIGR